MYVCMYAFKYGIYLHGYANWCLSVRVSGELRSLLDQIHCAKHPGSLCLRSADVLPQRIVGQDFVLHRLSEGGGAWGWGLVLI